MKAKILQRFGLRLCQIKGWRLLCATFCFSSNSKIESSIKQKLVKQLWYWCLKESLLLLLLFFSEAHHHHLLGSQRLPSLPCMWTSSLRGACGAQGGQPPTLMPARHRQRPARGKRCWETKHALAALLLCHHCFYPHHQGMKV